MDFLASRRNLIKAAPAAVATGLLMAGSTAVATPSVAATKKQSQQPGDWSRLTYQSMPLQHQLAHNRVAMTGKPYASFFDVEMAVPTAAAESLLIGQLKKSDTLPPSVAGINQLLNPHYRTPDHGYAVLDGSTVYVQSRTFMPGVTTDMIKWWFTWHPGENERYMLWYPHAHIENSVVDQARLADKSLSYEKRLYGNPNRVKEFINSTEPLEIIIHFTDPVELGLDAKALKQQGFTVSASAIVSPAQAPDVINSMMIHLGRNVDGGAEMVNRYWIGAHPDLLRFKGAEKAPGLMAHLGMNDQIAENSAYEFAVHDMIEFNHLAKILPSLYAQFGPL
jgi:2,4-diacetylphloroglucinol hydrolase